MKPHDCFRRRGSFSCDSGFFFLIEFLNNALQGSFCPSIAATAQMLVCSMRGHIPMDIAQAPIYVAVLADFVAHNFLGRLGQLCYRGGKIVNIGRKGASEAYHSGTPSFLTARARRAGSFFLNVSEGAIRIGAPFFRIVKFTNFGMIKLAVLVGAGSF